MKKLRRNVGILVVLMALILSSCAGSTNVPPTEDLADTETIVTTEETATETETETQEPATTAKTQETETETKELLNPETHDHTFVGATCTEGGKCKCGAVSEPLGHNFTGGSCTAAQTCSRCHAKGNTLPHSFTGGSCTEATACAKCGAKGSPLGHNFTGAGCTAPSTCTRCGLTQGEAVGHSYSGGRCTRCGDTNGPLQPWEAGLFRNKLTDEQNAQALAIARQIAAQCTGGTDLERIGMAAQLVSREYYKGVHKESGIYYSEAYGVFVARESSCAGCSRALGLVLTCMGYSWTHVNANQWTHQWVSVTVNGVTYYADGQVGWYGEGQHPYAG